MVRMPWMFAHLMLGLSFKEQWKWHLWQAPRWLTRHSSGDSDQRQCWCANSGWLSHNTRTGHHSRHWKTCRYSHRQRTWLQKILFKVGTENAHHRTHISPKRLLCRISSAQWERLRWFLSRIITSDEPLTGVASSVVAMQKIFKLQTFVH